jgi:hypothetical protein
MASSIGGSVSSPEHTAGDVPNNFEDLDVKSRYVDSLDEGAVDSDKMLVEQMGRCIPSDGLEYFSVVCTGYGYQVTGYAKINGNVVQHGPTFFVSSIDYMEEKLMITAYTFYTEGRKIGGLEEDIRSNRADYTLNGTYIGGYPKSSKDLVMRLFNRIKHHVTPTVKWVLDLPPEPYSYDVNGIYYGGHVSDYQFFELNPSPAFKPKVTSAC